MRTSFHHQPEAQHPNFPLSASWQADYPIFLGYSGREMLAVRFSHFDARPTFCVTTRECATDKSGSGLSAMRRPVWT
jgi:hypothetical protein